MDPLSLLKRVPVFALLREDNLTRIANALSLKNFLAGQEVFGASQAGALHLLKSGSCDMYDSTLPSKKVLRHLSSGDYFGLQSVMEMNPPLYAVEATAPVETYCLTRDQFWEILQQDTVINQSVLMFLSRRCSGLDSGMFVGGGAGSTSEESLTRTRVAFFSTRAPERKSFATSKHSDTYKIDFFEEKLSLTSINLVHGYKVICVTSPDDCSEDVVLELQRHGVELILLRCAGFNNIDVDACDKTGITISRVPAYSPHSVAEHAVALMMALNRRIHTANSRVHLGNFSLRGLVGFTMHGKTVGVVGTGKIGVCVVNILRGFGCRVLCHDIYENPDLAATEGVSYTDLDTLFRESSIITFHCPLLPETKHLVNAESLKKMKDGVMLINTSRGAIINSRDLIGGLKSGKVGWAGLDVYEEESGLFFVDHSDEVLHDDVLARLLTFNNVIITSHQGFLTEEALQNIADITLSNGNDYLAGKRLRQVSNSLNKRGPEVQPN
eukprot:Rmarinus@m.30129